MKKNISILLLIVMIMTIAIPVSATETKMTENNDLYVSATQRLQTAINQKNNSVAGLFKTISTGKTEASVSNLQLKIDYSKITADEIYNINSMTDKELAKYVEIAFNSLVSDVEGIQLSRADTLATSQQRASWTQDRYGDVWCGIPNGGWAYIRIYYNVKWTDNGGFTSAEYYDSWKTNGVTAGNWDPHFGHATVVNSALVEVSTTGTITYGIPDTILSASFDATFLHEDTCPYEI